MQENISILNLIYVLQSLFHWGKNAERHCFKALIQIKVIETLKKKKNKIKNRKRVLVITVSLKIYFMKCKGNHKI